MNDIICAIDIGSTICRILIARPDARGGIEVIGVGRVPSKGVRSGVIINIESAIQCIVDAVKEAELMSGLVVGSAYVNITGKHLHGENSRGVVAITNKERVVREGDVLRVIEGAQNIRIPSDQEIIHVLSREFRVDDQAGVRDPTGMTGIRLEAEVHIVTAGTTALTNLTKSVNGAGIQMIDPVMSSLASAEAVVTEDEKDLGVAVVDIGGGICDLILYLDGGVAYSSVIPIGGNHVTQDLSIGLKVPIESAEAIKKSYGLARIDAVDPTERVEIQGAQGRPLRRVLRQEIAEIIEPRMKEIFEFIDEQLVRSGKRSALSGGVVITGGGSMLEGSLALAEEVFRMPVTQGFPAGITGFTERIMSPESATVVGLLHYAARHAGEEPTQRGGGSDRGFMEKLKEWVRENL
jgi:cell division protein FtsA